MSNLTTDKHYRQWLIDIKQRIRQSQLKAATAVNSALLEFYWNLGADIVKKQKHTIWGSGFLKQLSQDLMSEFPAIKGFSRRNLKAVRQWYLFYHKEDTIGQQAVSQLAKQAVSFLTQIPWGHNIVIIQKCDTADQALFYVQKTIENNWSRSVLMHQIEKRPDCYGLIQRKRKPRFLTPPHGREKDFRGVQIQYR